MVWNLRSIADDLAGLVLPSCCPACGLVAQGHRRPWCQVCAPPVEHKWVRPTPAPAGFPMTARCGIYADPLRAGILAYKDGTRRDLGGDFGRALAGAVLWGGWQARPVLVPVPSTLRARRGRGFDHALDLARRTQLNLPGSTVCRPLVVGRTANDRGGMSAAERATDTGAFRMTGMSARRVAELADTGPIVVVDDVATSGWTLARAAGVLRRGGLPVAGAVVVASTLLRGGAQIDGFEEFFPGGADGG